jgi:hypothetical protein
VAVGPHPEQHDVEHAAGNLLADLQAVEPGRVLGLLGPRQRVQRRRLVALGRQQRLAHHPRVGVRVVVRHAALVAEPQVDVRPRALGARQQLVGALRRAAAGKRDVDRLARVARRVDPARELACGVARDRLAVVEDLDPRHGSIWCAAASAGA